MPFPELDACPNDVLPWFWRIATPATMVVFAEIFARNPGGHKSVEVSSLLGGKGPCGTLHVIAAVLVEIIDRYVIIG